MVGGECSGGAGATRRRTGYASRTRAQNSRNLQTRNTRVSKVHVQPIWVVSPARCNVATQCKPDRCPQLPVTKPTRFVQPAPSSLSARRTANPACPRHSSQISCPFSSAASIVHTPQRRLTAYPINELPIPHPPISHRRRPHPLHHTTVTRTYSTNRSPSCIAGV